MIVLLCGVVGVSVGVANWLQKDLPSPASLQTIAPPVKTLVYDINGKLVHEFYKENRNLVPLRQIPQTDGRRHPLDRGPALLHALGHRPDPPPRRARRTTSSRGDAPSRAGARSRSSWRGISSSRTRRRCTRKIKEAVLAVRIEQTYTKDEILEMYLNQIYFGEGAYGLDAAAKVFFGKQVGELTLPECALLAGLPRNPRDYSPRREPERALKRRNLVLASMLENKRITRAQYEAASEAPLGVTKTRYRLARRRPTSWRWSASTWTSATARTSSTKAGCRIYTTIDIDLQNAAEEALERRIQALEARNQYKRTRATILAEAAKKRLRARRPQTDYLQGAVVMPRSDERARSAR